MGIVPESPAGPPFTTEPPIIDIAWLSLVVLITTVTSTAASLLTLARSKVSLETSRESLAKSEASLAKSEASLFTSRLAAEALLALARGNAADLLEEARVRAKVILKTAADGASAAVGSVVRENTAALGENTDSVEANTRAVDGAG